MTRRKLQAEPQSTIGQRLRTIRLRHLAPVRHERSRSKSLTQTQLAGLLRVTRARLASYESDLVAPNFHVCWEICRRSDRSQLWLATGEGVDAPFLDVDIGDTGITDRTLFLDGVRELWGKLIAAAKSRHIKPALLPAEAPEPSLGISRPAPAAGRIEVTIEDRAAGRLAVRPEFMPGCEPPDWPAILTLVHPGIEAVDRFLRQQARGGRAAVQLLRSCLSPECRTNEFLRRLEPQFILELELASQRLVGVSPLATKVPADPRS